MRAKARTLRFKSDRLLLLPKTEVLQSETERTFTLFTRLPLEIQRMIWQQAQPQRVLELVFDDGTGYSAIEDPMLSPGSISKSCREARKETMRTFKIIPKGLPLVYIQPRRDRIDSDLTALSEIDNICDAPPTRLNHRIAWFEPERDILYWNGSFQSRRKWKRLEKNTLASGQLSGPIEKGAVTHVMMSADVFSAGFWNIEQTISMFPNLRIISILAGGMSLYEDSHAKQQTPVCTLVDLASESQKRKVGRAIANFQLPRNASDMWKKVRRHSEETNTDGAIRQRMASQHCTHPWKLSTVRYEDLCRSKVELGGDLESFKQAYLTHMWQRFRKVKGRGSKTEAAAYSRVKCELGHAEHVEDTTKQPVEGFSDWKTMILESLPRFRQVFVLRMHTYKNEAFGLEEITF